MSHNKTKSFVLLFLGLAVFSCQKTEIPNWENEYAISVMSFNMRYDTEEDGENKWSNRKQAVLDMLRETEPTIFGIQEGLHRQVTFLADSLPAYEFVGVGRDDGDSLGEYSAIFYSKANAEFLETDNFWLSETPDEPSLGWDANNIRIVTWAKFIVQQKTIYVFNTHFDHKGKIAREESAKLLINKIQENTEGEEPVFIIGDFNVLIGNSILEPITKDYLSARQSSDRADNFKSFNAWGRLFLKRNIDFIFYKNAKVLSFKTAVKDYGVPYISDHYPIIAHFDF